LVAPKNEVELPDIPRVFAVAVGIVTFVNPEIWNAPATILVTDKIGVNVTDVRTELTVLL